MQANCTAFFIVSFSKTKFIYCSVAFKKYSAMRNKPFYIQKQEMKWYEDFMTVLNAMWFLLSTEAQ